MWGRIYPTSSSLKCFINEFSVGIEITLLFGHGVKPGRVAIISEV